MGITEELKTLYSVYGLLLKRIEELEDKVKTLEGKKKCVIIEMKPKK